MRVAVLDTRVGNVHSLLKALATAGAEPRLESRPEACLDAPLLVLPGVGAYPAATTLLAEGRELVRERLIGGSPCLGICLGMQLLLEASDEGPGVGLGSSRAGWCGWRLPGSPTWDGTGSRGRTPSWPVRACGRPTTRTASCADQ